MKSRRDILVSTAAFFATPAILRAQDTSEPLRLEINGEGEDAEQPIVPPSNDPLAPTLVSIQPGIPAGEIHVDPNRFRLYWTLADGQAIRYAVCIGRRGLYESGTFRVGAKREWPSWTPTPEMIERDPDSYAQFADGVPGGPNNPLGARALYLFQGNRTRISAFMERMRLRRSERPSPMAARASPMNSSSIYTIVCQSTPG